VPAWADRASELQGACKKVELTKACRALSWNSYRTHVVFVVVVVPNAITKALCIRRTRFWILDLLTLLLQKTSRDKGVAEPSAHSQAIPAKKRRSSDVRVQDAREQEAPGGAPVRVEKSRIKVALLIAIKRLESHRFCVRLDVTRNKSCLDVEKILWVIL
jgi:hypothetical protein